MFKRYLTHHPYKLAFIWAAIIFGLCSTPGRFIPTTSWLELLSADKWVHAGVFFVLTLLLFTGVATHRQKSIWIFIWLSLSVLYGGMLEIMQAKVFSDRSADWQDFIANSFGCVMALFLYKPLLRSLTKSPNAK